MLSDSVIKWLIAGLVLIIVTLVAAMVFLTVLGKPGAPEIGAALTLAVGTFMGGQLFFGHAASLARAMAANNSLAQTVMSGANGATGPATGSNASADASATTGQSSPTIPPNPGG